MKLSRNEVSATLMKAARGQGLPLGHADVFVPAAVHALGQDIAASAEITTALRGPHLPVDFGHARIAMAGPVALDMLACGAQQIVLQNVDAPIILKSLISLNNNAICVEADVDGDRITLRPADSLPAQGAASGALNVPQNDWAIWQKWAALTYVPASDASRVGGAGAGLTDND